MSPDYATGALLHQLKSKVNWELVILWVIESLYKMKLDAQYILTGQRGTNLAVIIAI